MNNKQLGQKLSDALNKLDCPLPYVIKADDKIKGYARTEKEAKKHVKNLSTYGNYKIVEWELIS